MDECVNPRLPGFGSFLNLFRWYPPIIDSVKNYDVKETYRNTRFRRDSHFPLKQPDSGWNSNPSSGQIIHGICKPSTNVAMLPGAWKGFATRYCRAELGRLVYMCFWVAWWPVEKQKEGSLRQNLPRWNSIGGIRPYCFLVKISPFKTWLLEVITAMGRGLHWPLAVLSLEQVGVMMRPCGTANPGTKHYVLMVPWHCRWCLPCWTWRHDSWWLHHVTSVFLWCFDTLFQIQMQLWCFFAAWRLCKPTLRGCDPIVQPSLGDPKTCGLCPWVQMGFGLRQQWLPRDGRWHCGNSFVERKARFMWFWWIHFEGKKQHGKKQESRHFVFT